MQHVYSISQLLGDMLCYCKLPQVQYCKLPHLVQCYYTSTLWTIFASLCCRWKIRVKKLIITPKPLCSFVIVCFDLGLFFLSWSFLPGKKNFISTLWRKMSSKVLNNQTRIYYTLILAIMPSIDCCVVHTIATEEILEGKIGHVMLGIIHVILFKTSQCFLHKILQTRWPIIRDVVVCRHTNLPFKIMNIVFCSLYSVFSFNL